MSDKATNKLTKGGLLYSNCWEDADVLLEAFGSVKDQIVLSVGSAGDNCFSLLSQSPQKLILVDPNPDQLYLIELKKVAFERLSYSELKAFFGFDACSNRIQLFDKLRPYLSSEAKAFWSSHKKWLKNGIIYAGKLEKYFAIYRSYILPILVKKQTLRAFFAGPINPIDRQRYLSMFKRPTTQFILTLFFSKPIIALFGRKRELFTEVKKQVADHLIQVIGKFIGDKNAYKNHYLRFITLGSFGDQLPHYIRQENYHATKENLKQIEFFNGYLLDAISAYPNIHYINASDIFEYMTLDSFKQHATAIVQKCKNLKSIAYWNFMVDRVLTDYTPALTTDAKSKKLKAQDKLIFYQNFLIDKRAAN